MFLFFKSDFRYVDYHDDSSKTQLVYEAEKGDIQDALVILSWYVQLKMVKIKLFQLSSKTMLLQISKMYLARQL